MYRKAKVLAGPSVQAVQHGLAPLAGHPCCKDPLGWKVGIPAGPLQELERRLRGRGTETEEKEPLFRVCFLMPAAAQQDFSSLQA